MKNFKTKVSLLLFVASFLLIITPSFAQVSYIFSEFPADYEPVASRAYFHSGMLAVSKSVLKEGKGYYEIIYDYINTDGELQNLSPYSYGFDFSEGFAAIFDKNTKNIGYMNRYGDITIPMTFNGKRLGDPHAKIGYFKNGKAEVIVNVGDEENPFYAITALNVAGEVLGRNIYGASSSRYEGRSEGNTHKEIVTLNGEEYEAIFDNDVAVVNAVGYILETGKSGIQFKVMKNIPFVVKKQHKLLPVETTLKIKSSSAKINAYKIYEDKYVSLSDFLNLISPLKEKGLIYWDKDKKYVAMVTDQPFEIMKNENPNSEKTVKEENLGKLIPSQYEIVSSESTDKLTYKYWRIRKYELDNELYLSIKDLCEFFNLNISKLSGDSIEFTLK